MDENTQETTETLGLRGGISEQFDKQQHKYVARQSLSEYIISRMQHASEAASEQGQLRRLMNICDKHPEVMEIISLMRDLNLL